MYYHVYYAQLWHDKDLGVVLRGQTDTDPGHAYYGGTTDNKYDAEQLARYIVNNPIPASPYRTGDKGTLLPRVFQAKEGEDFFDVMYRALEWFVDLAERMKEADETIHRKAGRHRKIC